MTRSLAVDIKNLPIENILVVTSSILVLTLVVLSVDIYSTNFQKVL
jgi:hypothetical protein